MKKTSLISATDITHLAKLANLPISKERQVILADQIETTFKYIKTLVATDTENLIETNQVTGLTNVLREDIVDDSRTLTQEQALQNAKKTYNGFILVPAILE